MSITSCNICLSDRVELSEEFDSFSIMKCLNCGHGQVDPIPDQKLLDKLYNSVEYYASHMNYNFETINNSGIELEVEKNKRIHSERLDVYLQECKTMLEIGCGGGFALKGFEQMGLEAEGIETSDQASRFATDKLGMNVHHQSFETYSTSKKYDLVMLNHVLEHFIDPVGMAPKLASLLNESGYLYIGVPDYGSFDRKRFGKQWPAYAHYHISYFTATSLKILFGKHGLVPVRSYRFLSEKVPRLLRRILYHSPFYASSVKLLSGRNIHMVFRKN